MPEREGEQYHNSWEGLLRSRVAPYLVAVALMGTSGFDAYQGSQVQGTVQRLVERVQVLESETRLVEYRVNRLERNEGS